MLGYKEVNWSTHQEVIEALESASLRKLLVLPRGTFKSTIGCVCFPIWLLLKNPNLRIFIDSELYSNSKNFLKVIKGHLVDPFVTGIFEEFKTDSNWTEKEITIKQRTKIYKEASITCGGIGTEKTGQHYDVIICDDMNGPSNSLTPEGRQKVIDHYRMLTSILEPGGTIVVIGTRYADDDLIGFILKNEIGE